MSLSKYFVPWLYSTPQYNLTNLNIAWRDPDISRMMQNENPISPSKNVTNAIIRTISHLQFYPNQDTPLKEKIAKMYNLTHENVLLGNGSSEIIDAMMRVFLRPNDEVILPTPTFKLFAIRASLVGGQPVEIPVKRNTLETDIDGMIAAITDRTKLVVLVTPNNPTGIFIPEHEIIKVLETGIPTLIDEAYIEYHPESPSKIHLMNKYPNAFFIHTFSKAYGLAGIRFGYLLGNVPLVKAFEQMLLPFNISLLSLAAASAILDNPDELKEKVQFNNKWMKILYDECRNLGLKPFPPHANYMLIDASPFGKTSEEIYTAALTRKILVKQIDPIHNNKNFFRISPGTDSDNHKLIAFLKEYFNSRP